MPSSPPREVLDVEEIKCSEADTFAIMQENDDIQMLGVLDDRGQYSQMSELNKVGQTSQGKG